MTDTKTIPLNHPLQKLGARLAELLDDDQFNNCEPLLLQALSSSLFWITADAKPLDHKPVAVQIAGEKYKYWARAMWVPRYTLEDTGSYEGCSDYYETTDTYYWAEGWYEWNHAEEIHWLITDLVTHWAIVDLPEA